MFLLFIDFSAALVCSLLTMITTFEKIIDGKLIFNNLLAFYKTQILSLGVSENNI